MACADWPAVTWRTCRNPAQAARQRSLVGMPMSRMITDECINCGVCEPECPNDAISAAPEIYIIDAARCTECVGHYDEPRCVAVCPVDCIPINPDVPESLEALQDKYRRLMKADA